MKYMADGAFFKISDIVWVVGYRVVYDFRNLFSDIVWSSFKIRHLGFWGSGGSRSGFSTRYFINSSEHIVQFGRQTHHVSDFGPTGTTEPFNKFWVIVFKDLNGFLT